MGQLCSHIVNTNSQIGTVQDSYLALSCPVKSDLAALPAPTTPPNSFLFCTHSLSTSNFQPPDSPRVSIFAFQVSSNSFIYRFYAESLAISFIYRIYANHRGVSLKEKMNATKPSIINEPATTATPRCQHRSLKGRCRQLATAPAGTLCFDHVRAEQQAKNDFSLLAPLVRKCEDFQSAEALNETLGNLHNLLAEGRISPRRAAVIAYVDSLILRTLPAMAKQNGPTSIIFDMPGPDRDRDSSNDPQPEPTYADVRT